MEPIRIKRSQISYEHWTYATTEDGLSPIHCPQEQTRRLHIIAHTRFRVWRSVTESGHKLLAQIFHHLRAAERKGSCLHEMLKCVSEIATFLSSFM